MVLRPDKGNGVVIMDRTIYKNSCLNIISDNSRFKLLSDDPTLSREAKLQRFLRKLKKQGSLDDKTYQDILPRGSQPARFYGLPKLHKHRDHNNSPPLRPIVFSVKTYNYNLAKYLCSLLNPLIPDDYITKDSFSFVEELTQLDSTDRFLISFDVESLFTNIPLNETIEIAVDLIHSKFHNFPINKKDLTQLFIVATSQTHFLFDGSFYDQIDCVAMGSPLAPVLANLFMGHHERNWINDFNGKKPLFYRRYVDDTFCMFENENDAKLFLDYLNSRHNNIKFTFEIEQDNKIPFLDVLITKSSSISTFSTSVYHKKTYTGLLTNFFSFTSFRYKSGLVKTLLDRIYKINNTEDGLKNNLTELTDTLKRNSFPQHFIERIFNSHTNKQNEQTINGKQPDKPDVYYFKLPYIGHYSQITEQKLLNLAKRFCTDINIKLVFTSYKIKNMFSFKDAIPDDLKSLVVYQFICAGCNSCYIGETTRHLATRIKEHTSSDKHSHIYKHLQNPTCNSKYTRSCFTILDTANTAFSLKLKEALYIRKHKPVLNKQVQYFNTIFQL